jgi:hypothetical protein
MSGLRVLRSLLGVAIVGSVAIAAPRGNADHRFVNNEVAANDTRKLSILWDSQTSWSDCSRGMMAALRQNLADSKHGTTSRAMDGFGETGSCKEGVVGQLTQGTEVQVLAPTEGCGVGAKELVGVDMSRVKVIDGKYAGTIGCITSDNLYQLGYHNSAERYLSP